MPDAAVIVMRQDGHRFSVAMDAWPETALFSCDILMMRPERLRWRAPFVDINFDNGRAVYKVGEMSDYFAEGTLVYSEGPFDA